LAQARLLRSYQICQPGKKLMFMGAELGQWDEWNCKREIPWDLLQYDRHQQLQHFFKALNHFYLTARALWEFDFDYQGFEWIDFSDRMNCTLSYLRKGVNCYLLCVHHFTPTYVSEYFVCLRNVRQITEVFNTDSEEYGGSGKINSHVEIVKNAEGQSVGIQIRLAPLATQLFEVCFL
jgi:1,4-alpha-glucan branching enzyme